jgi:hypothetical protein
MDCHATASHHFCPKCGQKTRSPRGHFRILIADFFNSWLGAEAKLWPTIGRLFRRPGALTLDYREGRRTRYLSPLKIYFFFTVIFFLTLSWGSQGAIFSSSSDGPVVVEGEVVSNDTQNYRIAVEKVTSPIDGTWLGSLLRDRLLVSADRLDQLPQDQANQMLFRQMNADLPVALFLALPFIALALRVVFWRRELIYFDHFIFTLHMVAFFFATLLVMKPIGMFPLPLVVESLLGISLVLWQMFYFLRALKVSTGRGYLGGIFTGIWLGIVIAPTMVAIFIGLIISSVLQI